MRGLGIRHVMVNGQIYPDTGYHLPPTAKERPRIDNQDHNQDHQPEKDLNVAPGKEM